jgi:hypothetical protein
MLPEDQRAGILTQASLMAVEAFPNESSVVHRGVFTVRELLCFNPPPPSADDLERGEALKKSEPTERARAEKRAQSTRCAGCHAFFDPLGVSFEHYDTIGRYRTKIKTATGDVPVDASAEPNIRDVTGKVANAVELSKRLADSPAVRSCLAQQFASYAIGERLDDEESCTAAPVEGAFAAADGDFLQLVRSVATWDGLRTRREGGSK